MLCLLGLVLAAGGGRGSSWGRLIRKLSLWRWVSLPRSLVPCSERLHLDPENQVENKLMWSWPLAMHSAVSKKKKTQKNAVCSETLKTWQFLLLPPSSVFWRKPIQGQDVSSLAGSLATVTSLLYVDAQAGLLGDICMGNPFPHSQPTRGGDGKDL